MMITNNVFKKPVATSLCVTLLLFVLLPLSCNAVGFEYTDDIGANIKLTQQFEQGVQKLEELKKQYDALQQQLQTAKQLKSDAEGHYGFGSLLNSDSDLTSREWSPGSWDDALHGLSGGNPARYQQLVSQYKQANPTLSQSDYQKGASAQKAAQYQQQVKTNKAVTVNSSYAFDDIKTHLTNIHQLSEKIETAKDDKAAIDLNTRMQAEMAYVEVQILKQQTLLNEQMARASSDNIASETTAAKFNTLPN